MPIIDNVLNNTGKTHKATVVNQKLIYSISH